MPTYISPSKINLFLHILDKNNGLHILQSMFARLHLHDILNFTISNSTKPDILTIEGPFSFAITDIQNNLILRIIKRIKHDFNIQHRICCKLIKNIPVGSGLAGGSSNCAQTIQFMNNQFKLKMSYLDMIYLAMQFGDDVSVFIRKKHTIMVKTQDKHILLNKIHALIKNTPVILIYPNYPNSTETVFKLYNKEFSVAINVDDLLSNNRSTLFKVLKHRTTNDLSEAARVNNNHIAKMLDTFNHTNHLMSNLTGSGSACFAIYETKETAYKALQYLRQELPSYWLQLTRII